MSEVRGQGTSQVTDLYERGDGAARRPGVALVWRLALLWLMGANLRIAVLALAPVAPAIKRQLHLSEAAVGMLTTLPLLMLALGALAGSVAVARLGTRRALVGGLVLVGACSALRSVGDTAVIFAATVGLGTGIAIMQPAMPVAAQSWFPRKVGFATNVYGNGVLVGEAVAASLTLPLVLPATGSWEGVLAIWSVPALVTAGLMLLPASALPASETASREWLPRFSDGAVWRVALVQGGSSVLFLGTNAFLATYLDAVGRPGLVAPCLAALNSVQLAASVVVGLMMRRGGRPRPLVVLSAAGGITGLLLVTLASGWLAVVGAAAIGTCAATVFVVSLALPPLLAPEGEVHRFAAGMFSISYLLAFLLPLMGGIAWDATGRPVSAFAPALLGVFIFAAGWLWPGRDRHRLDVGIT